eukprot:SAG22_NODE_1836_length_3467_cov_15.471200_2_plen_135_part_00
MNQPYDPLNVLTFKVYFDDEDENQDESATLVKAYLDTLSDEQLQNESNKFFQWIVSTRVDTFLKYAESLLKYFHSKELLTQKKEVVTIAKQNKPRYVVIYDMDGKYFSRIYSSVREIQEDTGKKPSKLCKYEIT